MEVLSAITRLICHTYFQIPRTAERLASNSRLEGELPFAKDNHVVGQLRLDGLQPAAGMGDRPLVEVGFDLDVPRLMWLRSLGTPGGPGRPSSWCVPYQCKSLYDQFGYAIGSSK